jgi:hypothetical protein
MTDKHNYAVIDMMLTEEILRYLDVQHTTLAAQKTVATMIATHRLKYCALNSWRERQARMDDQRRPS